MFLIFFLVHDFSSFSLNSSPPFFRPPRPSPFSYSFLLSPFLPAASLRHIEPRRTKETVTQQLAKLLIYSLFNQINERVDAHFYAPIQLFMVYGNCPKRTSVPRPGPYGRPPCEVRLPDDPRPFFFRRTPLGRRSYVLYHFPLTLSLSHSFVFPFRANWSKSGLTTV